MQERRVISPTATALGLQKPGGTVSWLRKCTSKILKLSPIKTTETSDTEQANVSSGPSTMLQAATNFSFHVQRDQSETETREVELANANSDGDHSNINSKAQEVAADSGIAVSGNEVSTNVEQREAVADSRIQVQVRRKEQVTYSEAMSEDGNKTPERAEDGNQYDGEDDESDSEHPGNVSMGKKLWTFLTT